MQKMTQRQIAGVVLLTALAFATAGAQTGTAQPPAKPPEQPVRQAPEPVGPANIKLDLTITDQTSPGEPLKKVVTMVVADRGNGSIRSMGSVRNQGRVQINVDAEPAIIQNGAIRLRLGLEYNPRAAANDAATESSSLNERIIVILDPAKPMVVSQAADPASDRRITVEIRAAIIR